MNFMETFICPVCGSKITGLHSTGALLEEIRVDHVACKDCGSEWRVYSMIAKSEVEVTYNSKTVTIPANQEAATEETTDNN